MIIFIFIIGLVIGSFYNVVGMRLPVGKSIIKPGSHCPSCEHYLKWYELIPVVSFVFQKGKCKNCGEKISLVYPIVEILTGILFALSFYIYGISYEFFATSIISSVLIIIFVSDFKYKIILDSPIVIGSIVILILKLFYFDYHATFNALISGILVFGFMLAIKILGDYVFKRESLGGGDVKLAFFIGVCLGIQLGLSTLIIGCLLAFPYAIITIFFSKDNEIPFGPFLISATLITFYLMEPIAIIISKLAEIIA